MDEIKSHFINGVSWNQPLSISHYTSYLIFNFKTFRQNIGNLLIGTHKESNLDLHFMNILLEKNYPDECMLKIISMNAFI